LWSNTGMRFQPLPTTAPATGVAIYRFLLGRGVTQAWLARTIHTTQDVLNRKLRGNRGYQLTADDVQAISDALDVPAATRREWLALLTSSSNAAA